MSVEQKKLTDDQIEEMISDARLKIILRFPFYGYLIMKMPVIKATGNWCKTAATDYKNIYYNPEYFRYFNSDNITAVFMHELLHCIFNHCIRRDSREPEYWNSACDYAINRIIIHSGSEKKSANEKSKSMGVLPTKVDKTSGLEEYSILYDPKFDDNDGWFAEDIYEYLLKNPQMNRKTLDTHLSPNSSGKKGETVRKLLSGEGDEEGEGEGEESNEPSISEEEFSHSAKEFESNVREAYVASNGAGLSGSPFIAKIIDSIMKPRINWRDYLNTAVKSQIKCDYSWKKPNNRRIYVNDGRRIILPGMIVDKKIKLAIAIDSSGSISREIARDFMTEIYGIVTQYDEFEIDLWQFDTSIIKPARFTNQNFDEFMDYEIVGGGGTNFEVNWKYMKENEIHPKQFLMLTDGYPGGGWGDPTYVNTLFLIDNHENNDITPPFGTAIHYSKVQK